MPTKRNLTLAALLLASLFWLDAALARGNDCGIERNVKAKPLDESTWQRLNRIYEFVGEENYQQARDDLLSLEKRARGNRYLEAIVYQALAQVQWSLEDFDAALTSFERAVELDALPDEPHFSLMYQIAQLYYMKGRYTEALERLRVWFCKSPPERIKAEAWVLEASIHAQLKDWQKLIDAIDKAIAMEEEPKENWYQLKLAANFELEDFPAAADTLEVMIGRWPAKKLYWTQLSNVWFKLEQNDKALAVMALAYRNHLLDSQADYLYLSNLYSYREVPFKAAQILQSGLDEGIVESTERHWTILGDTWYAAEELENALAAFGRAGALADSGDIDLRRGYILADLERWEQAREALAAALQKGGLNDRKTGEAQLLLGMSEFNLGNWDQAEAAWEKASRIEQSRKAALQWRAHLREERARSGP